DEQSDGSIVRGGHTSPPRRGAQIGSGSSPLSDLILSSSVYEAPINFASAPDGTRLLSSLFFQMTYHIQGADDADQGQIGVYDEKVMYLQFPHALHYLAHRRLQRYGEDGGSHDLGHRRRVRDLDGEPHGQGTFRKHVPVTPVVGRRDVIGKARVAHA